MCNHSSSNPHLILNISHSQHFKQKIGWSFLNILMFPLPSLVIFHSLLINLNYDTLTNYLFDDYMFSEVYIYILPTMVMYFTMCQNLSSKVNMACFIGYINNLRSSCLITKCQKCNTISFKIYASTLKSKIVESMNFQIISSICFSGISKKISFYHQNLIIVTLYHNRCF